MAKSRRKKTQGKLKFFTLFVFIAVPLVIVLVATQLNFINFAAEPSRKVVLGMSIVEGVRSKDVNTSIIISAIDKLNRSYSDGGYGQWPGLFSIWTDFVETPRPYAPRSTFPNAQLLNALDYRHITPMIFMQPVGPDMRLSTGTFEQAKKYSNQSIANGSFDTYLRAWAEDAQAYGKPVILRFAHEMNGTWFPWSPYTTSGGIGSNYYNVGNTPANYVAMWRHVYNVIHPIAPNVKFYWCTINTPSSGIVYNLDIKDFFPGVNYVDYVGFDSYESAAKPTKTMQQRYAGNVTALRNLPGNKKSNGHSLKPIIVGETGIDYRSARRWSWLADGYPDVYDAFPDIAAISYFNIDMRTLGEDKNWMLTANPGIRGAYADLASQARFKGRFAPYTGPLTPTPPPTQTTTITTYSDSYVSSSAPNTIYGSQTALYTRQSPTEISYLKFNLSPLKGKTIVGATLVLTVSQATSGTNTLKYSSSNSWTEGIIKYSNRPTSLSTITTFNPTPLNGKINLNVRTQVNNRKGSTLTLAITGATGRAGFYSSEHSTAANRPQLIIQYR